jgi:hypothetical protein
MVALSSMESEVIAANLATHEAAWLRNMFMILDSRSQIHVNLGLDNQAAIYFANAASDTRTKHIDMRYYYIKSKVQDDTIQLWHIRSEINPADIFTKPLLGIIPIPRIYRNSFRFMVLLQHLQLITSKHRHAIPM